MRKPFLITAAAFLGFGIAATQAGDISFGQFQQSAQVYDGYWSVWAENNASLFGNIAVADVSTAGTLKAATQVVGAVNSGALSSTISNSIVANGPLVAQSVTTTTTNAAADAPYLQQGINMVTLNVTGPKVKDLPKLTAFAVNNADLYGGITVQNSTAGALDLSTTVAGAVNTATVTSNVSKTVSVLTH